MSKIVFDDEYVIVVPTFEEVQIHIYVLWKT